MISEKSVFTFSHPNLIPSLIDYHLPAGVASAALRKKSLELTANQCYCMRPSVAQFSQHQLSSMAEETSQPKLGVKTVIVFSMLFALLGAVVVFAYFATFTRPVTTVIL